MPNEIAKNETFKMRPPVKDMLKDLVELYKKTQQRVSQSSVLEKLIKEKHSRLFISDKQ